MIDALDVCRLLASGRFDLTREKATQADVHELLARELPAGCDLVREARLSPRDVPDFLIAGRIVVELKVKGAQRASIGRQLARYAEHPCVSDVILASNVSMSLPRSIGGKPVFFVGLGRAWL